MAWHDVSTKSLFQPIITITTDAPRHLQEQKSISQFKKVIRLAVHTKRVFDIRIGCPRNRAVVNISCFAVKLMTILQIRIPLSGLVDLFGF